MSSPSPSPSSPSLALLPPELLTAIASHLDRPTSLSYVLISRAFTSPADTRIWQELPLRLSPQPDASPRANPQADLQAKLEAIQEAGTDRRWGLVRRVKLDPMPGAYWHIETVLQKVQKGLRVLEVDTDQDTYYLEDREGHLGAIFDTQFHQWDLSFECLTEIRLGKHSIIHTECLPSLCASAPNLRSLRIKVKRWKPARPEITFPTFTGPTKLTYLRFSILEIYVDDTPPDHAFISPLLALLKHSPLLQQLAIDYDGYTPSVAKSFIDIVSRYEHLRDLHFPVFPETFKEMLNEDDPGFPALRRLVLSPRFWKDVFTCSLNLPNLELICLPLDYHPNELNLIPPSTHSPTMAQPIPPPLLTQLQHCPKLQHIHTLPYVYGYDKEDLHDFSRLDALPPDGYTGTVSSYRHGDKELFHARLLIHYKESEPLGEGKYRPYGAPQPERYALAGEGSEKMYDWSAEAMWHECTEFEGRVVPLEVLERMREAEGVSEEEWAKRGRWVGDEAWGVLMAWRDPPKLTRGVSDLVRRMKPAEKEKGSGCTIS